MADDERDDEALDRILAALANPHRRAIVYLLGLQPYAINQLAATRGLSLPAIHKHLTVLEDASLITRRKSGRTTYLTLKRKPLQRLQSWVGQFHPYWGSDDATYENYEQHLGRSVASGPRRPPDPPTTKEKR
jgi:DNA-binding transcriptional ArsR family regulator